MRSHTNAGAGEENANGKGSAAILKKLVQVYADRKVIYVIL